MCFSWGLDRGRSMSNRFKLGTDVLFDMLDWLAKWAMVGIVLTILLVIGLLSFLVYWLVGLL